MSRRRFLAPEVIQTSAMDCGPASLKCLLEGFGVGVSYGRLREACQTDVDGTSIDVLEQVANQLGIEAEQTMIPLDHLLLPEADAFPALLVVRNPDGATHFVVAWARLGPRVQVMDPGSGRRWVNGEELIRRTHVHSMPVPAEAWREWAGTDGFLQPLRARMRRLGALASNEALITRCAADPSWRSLATLDAATRMTDELVRAGALARGPEAARLFAATFAEAIAAPNEPEAQTQCIPPSFWSAGPTAPADDGEARVLLRGAVLVHVKGRAAREAARSTPDAPPLSPELAAALEEKPTRPLRELFRVLREDGVVTPGLVAGAALTAAVAGAIEALVLRGLLGVSLHLGVWWQRAGALAVLGALFVLSLCIELPIASQTLRMGRRLEMRFRVAFLSKIPRLADRYFSSRPASDMSHRAHAIHVLRNLPQLGARMLRSTADLLVAGAGIVWLDRSSWPYALAAVVACLLLPLATQRALSERDARVRAFDGALTRFYLDALLGLVPVRTHGAGRAIRREHDGMLREYGRAFLGLLSVATTVDALVALVSAVMTVGLLGQYLARGGDPAGSLLLVYWALSLPATGTDLAVAVHHYPELRNTTERLLEPLGALEEGEAHKEGREEGTPATPKTPERGAVELRFEGVDVVAGGKPILQEVDLAIPAGAHVAVVGSSGAGKSSLCGLLLGWHRPARGEVFVDGSRLRASRLEALRRETAWVDPAIRLWNRSLLDNVTYGAEGPTADLAPVLDAADAVRLLEQLPHGMQTALGDGGALVSGGEGQRVRLARAMLRPRSRLVVLDEPFRGLDRDRRRQLLARARELWKDATLLCVTHDVEETRAFDRVLVVHEGRVVEERPPGELAARVGSRYRALLDAERSAIASVWRARGWRRIELRAGVVVETHDEGVP
jgi:ATP-binding cassette subfamily B protein